MLGKMPFMGTNRASEGSTLPDPVIPNPGQPQVPDPLAPEFAPQPTQPEIQEPPPAPVEIPQPGIRPRQ